ncbi:hypothetical protein [Ruficoccus sp. ZRK36]|uniref:hypothetical protein n=1 Tax=Ruficoccus sp. ZRK36 TaxID=2866311 RepID=UPI001C731597|nr:hypothetical protein [Ruficoccus sp. ZRK36]QYY36493.1 hypothetical protein K0V07_03250 [Ruficoccus sp. ZRK36]
MKGYTRYVSHILLLLLLVIPGSRLLADQELGYGYRLSDNKAAVDISEIKSDPNAKALAVTLTYEGEEPILISLIPFAKDGAEGVNRDELTPETLKTMSMLLTGVKDPSHVQEIDLGEGVGKHLSEQGIQPSYCFLTWDKLYDYKTGKAFNETVYAGSMLTLFTDKVLLQAFSQRYPVSGEELPTIPVELMKRLAMDIKFTPERE